MLGNLENRKIMIYNFNTQGQLLTISVFDFNDEQMLAPCYFDEDNFFFHHYYWHNCSCLCPPPHQIFIKQGKF